MLAFDAFRNLLRECAPDAVPGSLLGKFVRLAREMHSWGGSSDSVKDGCAPSALKDGAMITEDPVLADWFYDVFPPSSGGLKVPNGSVPNGIVGLGVGSGGGGSQEDAEEFLSFVLNALHEELVAWEGGGSEKFSVNGVAHGDARWQTVEGRIHMVNGRGTSTPATGSAGGRPSAWGGADAAAAGNGIAEEDVWTEMTKSGKSVEVRGGEFAQSGVTDIFGGALRSEVKRARAKPSVTREPFFSLSLDIESGLIRDVEHALSAYFEPEFVEGYTMEGGDDGKGLAVDARKQVMLMQMPHVLILHLKRFSHNSATGALNKVSRNMMFPEVLRVPGRVMHKAGSGWGSEDGKNYELIAAVTHVGKELAGGHYTCDVRWDGEDDQRVWFTCDDSKVVRTNWQKVCRKQAYLLFYSAVMDE